MIRRFLVACVVAATAATAHADAATTQHQAAGTTQGTVILLHGMASNRALWDTTPYAGLRDHLVWLGWNVITVDLPDSDDPSIMADRLYADIRADGGTSYRARWDTIVHTTVDQALELGPRVIVGGVSWGGLHAILAACDDQRIAGWFVHAPVIRPEVLDEFRFAPAPALDGMACADRLRGRPGYVSYGDQDGRVGVDLPPAFGAATAATVRPFPGLDHTTTTETVDYIAQWVAHLPPPPAATPPLTPAAPVPATPRSSGLVFRDCGSIPGTQTGRLQANTATPCQDARRLLRKILVVVSTTGHPYTGPVGSFQCRFRPTGHVAVLCRDGQRAVRLWAGKRT